MFKVRNLNRCYHLVCRCCGERLPAREYRVLGFCDSCKRRRDLKSRLTYDKEERDGQMRLFG